MKRNNIAGIVLLLVGIVAIIVGNVKGKSDLNATATKPNPWHALYWVGGVALLFSVGAFTQD